MLTSSSIIAHESGLLEQTYYVSILDKRILTTFTSISDNANDWISNVNKIQPLRLIVGLDLKLGTTVALLVLFVYRSCLIFELTYADTIPPSLIRFLSDPNNTFVGVAIQSKFLQLRREYGLGERARHVDLASLAAERYNRVELNNAGLTELRSFLHGGDVQRPPVADNWDSVDLSNEYVHRACIDAYVCYELGSYLVYPMRRR